MKMLHIIPSMHPKAGGPSEFVRQLHCAFKQRGHESEAVSLDDPSESWIAEQIMPVHATGPGWGKYGYSKRFKPWLKSYAANYDAIIIEGIWQFHSFASFQVLSELGIPYLIFTHGMLDVWDRHYYPLKQVKKDLYWPWAEYRVLRNAFNVLYTCEEERLSARLAFSLYRANEEVVNFGTGAPPNDAVILREQFFAANPELVDKRLFTFLGRIYDKKGCDLLVQAFSRVATENPQLHLVMAGPDQAGWVQNLQEMAQKLGIGERISWTGMVQNELKWGLLYASEVLVMPSHRESFGLAVVEAMACGVPVLITDKVNIWREIESSGSGLVASDTVEGITQLLRDWLVMPLDARMAMAHSAKSSYSRSYTLDAMADSVLTRINAMRQYVNAEALAS